MALQMIFTSHPVLATLRNLTKDERYKVKKALSKLETELFGDKK